jgi:hypothetical protein
MQRSYAEESLGAARSRGLPSMPHFFGIADRGVDVMSVDPFKVKVDVVRRRVAPERAWR